MARSNRQTPKQANHGERQQKPNRPIKVAFNDFRFVRIELTEQEKTQFRSLLDSGEFDDIVLDTLLEEGYKLSISFDATHSSFTASLTAQYRDMDNAGLVLTGRGKSASVALAAVNFKHIYLCPDGLWQAVEDARGGSYSDIG